jgi:cell division protein FtsI/penicillin-binding protein 2
MAFTSRGRAAFACCGLVCVFTGFSSRLVHLHVTRHEHYAEIAADNHGLRKTIVAQRGMILDVNRMPLAQNEPVKTVIANATRIKDFPLVSKILAEELKLPEDLVLRKLQQKRFSAKENGDVARPYIILKKEVPELVANSIAERMASAKQRGVDFEQGSIRVYPNADMLCHVIGFINHERRGMEGVERSMDDYLRGHDGFRYTETDLNGREIVPYRGQERPPRNGCDVRLTIDLGLQAIVESEMDAVCKQYRPNMAVGILMRPQTGEVLALVNRPHFNLNQRKDVPDANRKNRAIMDMVEPGSTFKIVTTAAALTEKLVQPDTVIFCENGSFRYGGKALRDHHPYAGLSVTDILVKSSNIGVAKMGIQLGDQRLHSYIRKFGFGDRTGINLPGEIGGQVNPPHRWSKISITHIPMGHEVATTPMQIATAMAAVANGGKLMMPQIVADVTDDSGTVLTAFPPNEVHRVISSEVATQVKDALVEVVGKKGTAQKAAVAGFKVAGKTGTAQKISPLGGYERGKYVVSFAGFMPADNPEFVCLVMIDDAKVPSNENYGGLIAAPVFQRIAERAARYMNLQPTEALLPEGETLAAAEHIRD